MVFLAYSLIFKDMKLSANPLKLRHELRDRLQGKVTVQAAPCSSEVSLALSHLFSSTVHFLKDEIYTLLPSRYEMGCYRTGNKERRQKCFSPLCMWS